MLRMMALALAMLLCCLPAMAEGTNEGIEKGVAAKPGEMLTIDLDGDGIEETVSLSESEADPVTVTVTSGEAAVSYETEVYMAMGLYAADLDDDGRVELLVSGDLVSDDYYTTCLRYQDGALYDVLFPDAERGENTEGYYRAGYGAVDAISADGTVTLTGSQDMLGTYFLGRSFKLSPSGRFEFADDGFWRRDVPAEDDEIWDYEYCVLRPLVELEFSGVDGSTGGTLKPGDEIYLVATDKEDTVIFAFRDGTLGSLSVSRDYDAGWGSLVNGIPEATAFELCPYAD